MAGDSNIVVTGGTENMSQCPFVVRNVRFGTTLGAKYVVMFPENYANTQCI